MKIKNLIFDWSGTLFNDFDQSYLATRHTIQKFGGPFLTKKQYREQFDLPVWKFYRRHVHPGSKIDDIDKYYFDYFASHARRSKLFKQVKKILKTARQKRIRLFIYSTVKQSLLKELCQREGIDGFFKVIAGSVRDKERGLPAFCKKHRLSKKETLFIGDMEHDVRAAKKAGVYAGAVGCGYHTEERLLHLAPDFFFNDDHSLLGFIQTINSQSPSSSLTKFPLATVGALIVNKGQIFLVQTHKWGHTYGIPGGKIEKGERLITAVKREIKEETGMRLSDIRLACVQDSIDSKEFYKPKQHFVLINFYAKTKSRRFKLNDESETGIWIDAHKALKLRLNQPTRVLIKQYLNGEQ